MLWANLPALANLTLLPVPIAAVERPNTLFRSALGGMDANPPALNFRENGVTCGVNPAAAPGVGLLAFPPPVNGAGVVVRYAWSKAKGVVAAGVGMGLKRAALLEREGVRI